MKVEPEEPTVAAAVAYFVDMAKGKTAPSKHNGRTGLGAVQQPATYHVIPNIKLVTPTAQAVARAKDRLVEQEVIRGWPASRKRNAHRGLLSAGQKKKKKQNYIDDYQTPGLD